MATKILKPKMFCYDEPNRGYQLIQIYGNEELTPVEVVKVGWFSHKYRFKLTRTNGSSWTIHRTSYSEALDLNRAIARFIIDNFVEGSDTNEK